MFIKINFLQNQTTATTTHTKTQNSLTLKTASILEILSFGTDISFSNVRNSNAKNCNNEMQRQKAAGSPCPSPSPAPCRGGHNPDPLAVPFSAHALRMAAASQSECRHQSQSQSQRQSLPTGLGHDVVPGDGGRKFTRVLNTRLPRTALRTRAPLASLPHPFPSTTSSAFM